MIDRNLIADAKQRNAIIPEHEFVGLFSSIISLNQVRITEAQLREFQDDGDYSAEMKRIGRCGWVCWDLEQLEKEQSEKERKKRKGESREEHDSKRKRKDSTSQSFGHS